MPTDVSDRGDYPGRRFPTFEPVEDSSWWDDGDEDLSVAPPGPEPQLVTPPSRSRSAATLLAAVLGGVLGSAATWAAMAAVRSACPPAPAALSEASPTFAHAALATVPMAAAPVAAIVEAPAVAKPMSPKPAPASRARAKAAKRHAAKAPVAKVKAATRTKRADDPVETYVAPHAPVHSLTQPGGSLTGGAPYLDPPH